MPQYKKKIRIAVDACILTARPTGVAQYLMAAINVLSEQQPDVEYLLLAHKPLHSDVDRLLRQADNIRFACCPAPPLFNNSLFWLIFCFTVFARKSSATHIWGPAGLLPFFGCHNLKTILTVHDLVFRSLPNTMSFKTLIAYYLLSGHAIRNAQIIWAVSEFTKNEIQRYYPRRKSQHIIIGSGLNPSRNILDISINTRSEIIARYGIHQKSLLFVGTLEPRKNLAFLLSLMPELAEDGWNLFVVGCSGWGESHFTSIINSPSFPKKSVVFCDYVSDADLHGFYITVAFFISTSLMEGFGLPQLEAMSVGCPVIAASNSALIEVVGDGGVLVSGWVREIWCKIIKDSFYIRSKLAASAIKQAQQYTIDKVCIELYTIINSYR